MRIFSCTSYHINAFYFIIICILNSIKQNCLDWGPIGKDNVYTLLIFA